MATIIITGTPGTGKTTLAKLIEKKLQSFHLDLHPHYKQLSTHYNRKKQCYDLDMKKVEALLKKTQKRHKHIVLDSHISHLLPKKLVNLCVILTCSNLKKLEKRLKERKYSKKKIRENLDAEIFQVCLLEAQQKHKNTITFDTAKRITQKGFLSKIQKVL